MSIAKDIALGTGGGMISYALTGGSDELTLSGAISGTTSLTKTGAGTVKLTGTNSGGAWATTVSAGALSSAPTPTWARARSP